MSSLFLLTLCCFVFASTVAAECGDSDSDWKVTEDFQIRGFIDATMTGSVDDCKSACQLSDNFTCRSFEYYANTLTCTLSSKTSTSKGVLTEDMAGVTTYELYCDDDDNNVVVEFVEDNPELAALIGMGALILLLFMIAIILICVMSPRSGDGDYKK